MSSGCTNLGEGFNALPRAFFFSTGIGMRKLIPHKCFNALPRAFFFSTDDNGTVNVEDLSVSMPYLGLSSFLLNTSGNEDTIELFQCPTTGFLLFYDMILSEVEEDRAFQCPTTGFLLFYNMYRSAQNLVTYLVSMPYHGLSSFLRKDCNENWFIRRIVSMPYHGLSSFLLPIFRMKLG